MSVEQIELHLQEALDQMEVYIRDGKRLPMDSRIREQVIRLQALIELQWEEG